MRAGVKEIVRPRIQFFPGNVAPRAALPFPEIHFLQACLDGDIHVVMLGHELCRLVTARQWTAHDTVKFGQAGKRGLRVRGKAVGQTDIAAAIAYAGGNVGLGMTQKDQSHDSTPR